MYADPGGSREGPQRVPKGSPVGDQGVIGHQGVTRITEGSLGDHRGVTKGVTGGLPQSLGSDWVVIGGPSRDVLEIFQR